MRLRHVDRGCELAATTGTDLSGQCLGADYQLVEQIGAGATGRVWRALDRKTGDQVAVKLLRPELMAEAKAVSRFVQEHSILTMLRHDNIVRLRELLTVDDSMGLVMDLVDGGSLRDQLRQHRTLAPAVAAAMLGQVAAALAEAHRKGVAHRDLKPDNVLLSADLPAPTGIPEKEPTGVPQPADDGARTPRVRLTDFGIARLLDSPGITTPHILIGTPDYLAPEVITGGAPSCAVDIYAFGALLYEVLYGRPPFTGGPALVVLRRHLECQPRRFPGVPDQAWDVIRACLSKDPGQRPAATDLIARMEALAAAAEGVPAAAPAPVVAEQPYVHGRHRAIWRRAGRAIRAIRATSTQRHQARRGPAVPSIRRLVAPLARRTAAPPARRRVAPPARRRVAPPARRMAAGLAALCAVVVAAVALATGPTGPLRWPGPTGQDRLTPEIAAPRGGVERGIGQVPRPRDDADQQSSRTPAPGPSGTPAPPRPRADSPNGRDRTGRGPGNSRRGDRKPAKRPASRSDSKPPEPRTESVRYGPPVCGETYHWQPGRPTLVMACHSGGSRLSVSGMVHSFTGMRLDVSLTLRNAATGSTAAGPFTCRNWNVTALRRMCGSFPTDVPQADRRYVVELRWSHTGRPDLPSGTVRTPQVRW